VPAGSPDPFAAAIGVRGLASGCTKAERRFSAKARRGCSPELAPLALSMNSRASPFPPLSVTSVPPFSMDGPATRHWTPVMNLWETAEPPLITRGKTSKQPKPSQN
jgi:hypothetical protein